VPKTKPTPAPKDYSARAAFSVDEWITDIYPQSRAKFYEEVNAGRIKTFLDGRLRKVPASERTEVRIMYDGRNLLIGVHAFDAL